MSHSRGLDDACSKVEDSLNRTSMDRAERRQRRLDQKQNWGGGVIGGRKKDASRGLDQESVDQRASKCADCGSEEKKLARRGPLGPRTLCNSCGLKWAAKKKARNATRDLQDTSSEGESVEDIVQERGAGMYIKDLERKLRDLKSEQQKMQNDLHLSDANVNTYRKLSEQKQNKIDELETKVGSLTEKIGQISSPVNGVSSAAEAENARLRSEARCLEEKLRTEVRLLEEKNTKLVENMQLMSDLLSKNFSAGKEILAESIQINGDHKSRSWRSGAVTDQQQLTAHHQESKKASNVVRTKHDERLPPGFDGDVDVDADIGDNEPDYLFRRPERVRATGNLHEDPVHVSNGGRCSGSDTAGKSRDHEWERGYHCRPADLGNGVLRDRRSDEVPVRVFRRDVEGRCDKRVPGGNSQRFHGGCSGEERTSRPLFSHDTSLLARKYVEQSFITWVNSKLRKPTPEEMVYHKTRFTTHTNGKTCYWSGIPGCEILAQYEEAYPRKEVPDNKELELVLRTILNIEACAMRPTGVLWLLVWQDCVKIEQLPGYHDVYVERTRREMRRPRSPVVADDEDSDRSLRQRCA